MIPVVLSDSKKTNASLGTGTDHFTKMRFTVTRFHENTWMAVHLKITVGFNQTAPVSTIRTTCFQ